MSDTFIRRDTCVLDVPPISVYSYDRDVISLGSFVISHRIVVTTIKHLAAHTLKFIQKKQGDEIIEGHLSFLNIYTEPPPDVNRKNPKEIPLVYLTTIDVLPAYATIFNLGFENISRAGICFAWNIHQGNLCLRMYIDKKRVAECVEKADIDSANCETSSGKAAFISLYNALLRLTHPRHQQAIDSADRSFGRRGAGREDFDSFFRQVETARQNLPPLPKYSLSLDGMTSRLRPYQEEAVRFMMHRELSPQLSCFDHLYRNIFLTRGVYYYPFLGVFCKNKSEAKMPSVPGGILADEMGLGKTVEFLALTLCLTKGNKDRVDIEPDITANQQSDICSIRETVDDLVSSVVAATDGQMGLAAMRAKTSTLERRLNTCFDVKEPEGKKERKRDGDSKKDTINCAGCGANCIKKKMHWLDEYTSEGYVFSCPDCMAKDDARLSVAATLLVLPQSILHQWYEEIRKHVKQDVVIDIYRGVSAEGYKHPVYLAKCHIVLCAYETLSKELVFVKPSETRTLRKRSYNHIKRVLTPLLAVDWFRIGVDESQLLGGLSGQVAELCGRLSARARWCITGTPLRHSVNDLFGLVSFLGCSPLNLPFFWDFRFWFGWQDDRTAPDSLTSLVAHIMLRRTKEDIGTQLNLPTISTDVVEVVFSPLEERLYSEKLRELRTKMRELLEARNYDLTTRLNSLPILRYTELMNALNELRLTLVTGGGFRSDETEPILSVFSSKALYLRLLLKNKHEIEDAAKKMVSKLLQLAGIYGLYDKEKASRTYLRVSDLDEQLDRINTMLGLEEKDEAEGQLEPLSIDPCQMAHLSRNWPLVYEDHDIYNQFRAIYQVAVKRYTKQEKTQFMKLVESWFEMEEEWKGMDSIFDECFEWIEDLPEIKLLGVDHTSLASEMIPVEQEMDRQNREMAELREKVTLWISGDRKVFSRPDAMKELISCGHNKVWKSMTKEEKEQRQREERELMYENYGRSKKRGETAKNIVRDIASLRAEKLFFLKEKNDCAVCCLRKAYYRYQTKEGIIDLDMLPLHVENSPTYQLCVNIYDFVSYKKPSEKGLKKESLRKLKTWFNLRTRCTELANRIMDTVQELISRHLDLRRAVRPCAEVGMEVTSVCRQTRLARKVELVGEENEDMKELTDWLESRIPKRQTAIDSSASRITYLKTLSGEDESVSRECPMCLGGLEGEWYILPCGHVSCTNCYQCLKNLHPDRSYVECASCRAKTTFDVISLVQSPCESKTVPPEESAVPGVVLTVKFNAIVKRINQLLAENLSNKLLVFTSMTSSVSALCEVLDVAGMPYRLLTKANAPDSLAAFRNEINERVLVVPLSVGANGLNLNQANHVLFLEPITQPSIIQQAIGRMSRFGQTRSMTVHHFVIKGSIEEEILRTSEGGSAEDAWTVSTLVNVLGIQL